MKPMMTLFMAGLVGLATCAHGAGRPINPFDQIKTGDVGKVQILADTEVFSVHNADWRSKGVVITNKGTIARMVTVLSGVVMTNRVVFPAIGVLGSQVFLGKTGEVLAVTTIINYRATVTIDRSLEEDSYAGGQSVEYCRIVYDIMKEVMPARIRELDAMYRGTPGKSLEELLFGTKKRNE